MLNSGLWTFISFMILVALITTLVFQVWEMHDYGMLEMIIGN
ncbi:hypothetical protein AAEX28_08780 [Lentisphaerota bacterium WC36G]